MSAAQKQSLRPIDPQNVMWSARIAGTHFSLQARCIDKKVHVTKPRGEVIGFSRAARKRMLEWVSEIDWDRVLGGLFITLTLPDESWPAGRTKLVQWRHQWMRDIENYLGKQVGLLWRAEWVPRQSGNWVGEWIPHLHMLIPTVPFIWHEVVGAIWGRIVGARENIVYDVSEMTEQSKYEVYMAKYCAKEVRYHGLDYVAYLNMRGRHWGYHREELIPRFPEEVYHDLPEPVVHKLRKIGAEELPSYSALDDPGFSLFGPQGEKRVAEIEDIILDSGVVPAYDDSNKGR